MAPLRVPVRWTIVPLESPRVRRRCARCDRERVFACSERVRINANKRRLDVWLIYGCADCGRTWNLPVFERIAPSALAPELYARLLANDPDTARTLAFEAAMTRPERFDHEVPVRVERSGEATGEIELVLAAPCRVRLDRVLAGELGMSRSALRRAVSDERLTVPGGLRALRRPIRSGQVVAVSGPES